MRYLGKKVCEVSRTVEDVVAEVLKEAGLPDGRAFVAFRVCCVSWFFLGDLNFITQLCLFSLDFWDAQHAPMPCPSLVASWN